MTSEAYYLLFKTSQSELRAVENIIHSKKKITPIIELTRGRKSKYDDIGDINKYISRLAEVFKKNNIILDLTSHASLTNPQIDSLYDFYDGYQKWIQFLIGLKNREIFSSISPCLLQNFEDQNYSSNFIKQYKDLSRIFDTTVYRNLLVDDGCYDDLEMLKSSIIKSDKEFIFLIDCEFVPPGAWQNYSDKIIERINKIKHISKNIKFIIAATSFPRFVGEIGDDKSDTFRINEINIFNKVIKSVSSKKIFYGDYGSINPIRNDNVKLKNGWIPRIDIPLKSELFYHRRRKKENEEYKNVYFDLAKNYSLSDKRFPKSLTENWGIRQVKLCAAGKYPGASPSFWISVRMNIHIEQQLRRMKLLK